MSLLMLAMSLAVAVGEPLWSPIDEGSHWATAHQLVTQGTYPTIDGPIYIPPDLPVWPSGQDYQAGEPPLGYVLFGAVELVTRAITPSGPGRNVDRRTVHAERLANSLLLAVLIPLLWLCARLVAPANAAFQLGVPAGFFVFRGLIIDGSRVSNDVLVSVLATFALYLYLRRRESLTARYGLLVGLVIGLATLAKYQGAYAFIPIGLLILARMLRAPRQEFGPALRFLLPAVIVWALLLAPWFAFQYQRYGDFTGSSVERQVLPAAALVNGDPGAVLRAMPFRFYFSAMLAEVLNPLDRYFIDFNGRLAELGPALLLLGALVLLLPRVPGGLTRLERLAVVISAAAMVLLLVAITLASGLIVTNDARNLLPALLPATVLVAAPLLLLPAGWRPAGAAVVVVLASALALFSGYVLHLPWPVA